MWGTAYSFRKTTSTMKIVILDYSDNSIQTMWVGGELAERLESGDEDAQLFLSNNGYDLDNINWMFSDEDAIPVYKHNEVIPYTSL